MTVDLFDQPTILVVVFSVTVVVVIGLCLLLFRVTEANRRRRLKMLPLTVGATPAAAPRATQVATPSASAANFPAGPSGLELQIGDLNHALFLVLMECCTMISELGDDSAVARSDAFKYAANLLRSGRSSMSNKEMADHGYQIAAHLTPFNAPALTTIRRVLTQLAKADRWETKLQGAPSPFDAR